jgi:hypothetical protein
LRKSDEVWQSLAKSGKVQQNDKATQSDKATKPYKARSTPINPSNPSKPEKPDSRILTTIYHHIPIIYHITPYFFSNFIFPGYIIIIFCFFFFHLGFIFLFSFLLRVVAFIFLGDYLGDFSCWANYMIPTVVSFFLFFFL